MIKCGINCLKLKVIKGFFSIWGNYKKYCDVDEKGGRNQLLFYFFKIDVFIYYFFSFWVFVGGFMYLSIFVGIGLVWLKGILFKSIFKMLVYFFS